VRPGKRRTSRITVPLSGLWLHLREALPRLDPVRIRTPEQPFFSALHGLLNQDSEVSLGGLVDSAGEQTYGLLVLLLALPSLVPGISLGTAPIGGLGIMVAGVQMLRGIRRPWIPERIRRQPIHKGRMKQALARLENYLDRFGGKREERRALDHRWMGLVVAWSGFLLFLPVPLPFGNQFPAVILIALGAALLEERPLWGWLGALACLANTLYFALSFNLITRECLRMLRMLNHWLC
jgi:hypothetical protein